MTITEFEKKRDAVVADMQDLLQATGYQINADKRGSWRVQLEYDKTNEEERKRYKLAANSVYAMDEALDTYNFIVKSFNKGLMEEWEENHRLQTR